MSDYRPNDEEHWSHTAIAALKLAVKFYDKSPDEVVPSWYLIANDAITKHEKDEKPLSEYDAWQYAQR